MWWCNILPQPGEEIFEGEVVGLVKPGDETVRRFGAGGDVRAVDGQKGVGPGSISTGRQRGQRIWLVRMDLTRHRSAKKVAVPHRLTQLLGGTKISLERMGMGLVACFLETYGRPENIFHTVRYAIPARGKCNDGRRQLLSLQQKREPSRVVAL